MKTIRTFLLAILFGTSLTACAAGTQPTATPFSESMKGYELYSWQESGEWKFSLLVGTNREKTLEEIQSAEVVLSGVEALTATLKQIPAGQYITWSTRESLALPPDEILKQVEQTCEEQGLILNVAS